MPDPRYQRLKDIFNAASDAAWSERAAVLEHLCSDDPDLRTDVETLLDHADDPAVDLDSAASAMSDLLRRPPPPVAVPEVPGFQITRVLGEGGMGVVYLAKQLRPQRTVALKILRTGIASRTMLRRFEHEAQTLARLQHPGIAQVYEVGSVETTLGAQPYFVMEHVAGLPLVEHAGTRKLDRTRRLRLMGLVCEAVEHAHQRGVIHRDLKPSNIIVTADGRPKILDFGIARSLDDSPSGGTLRTIDGLLIGTLPYMSPEQAAGHPEDIDIRSDVYALGVLCYELLTDHLPHDLSTVPLPEAVRIIRDDVPRPLESWDRGLRGDLETIVHRALDKDKARRYRSAAALADDLQRCLAGEPIAARRDSLMYVMQKRLRRYRWTATAAALFVLVVAGFAAYAAVQSSRLQHAAQRERAALETALAAENAAREAHAAETQQRRIAQAQADRAQSITSFLVDTLGLTDPDVTQTADMTVLDLLVRLSDEVAASFADQPEAEVVVRAGLGRAFFAHGHLELAASNLQRARRLTREAVQLPDAERYEILWPLAQVLGDVDDPFASDPFYEAEHLGRAIIRASEPDLAAALVDMRREMIERFDHERAQACFERVQRLTKAALPPGDPRRLYVADQLHLFGHVMGVKRQPAAACEYLDAALALERELLPETHTRIVRTLGLLVSLRIEAGDHEVTEHLAREALADLEQVLPAGHWYIAVGRSRVGAALIGQGRFDEAERLLTEAHEVIAADRGETSAYVRDVMRWLLQLYELAGEPAKAEQCRLAYARGFLSIPQHKNWGGVEPALAPGMRGLREVVLPLQTALADRRDVRATLDAFLARRPELLPDHEPRAAVLADYLLTRGEYHANNGGRPEVLHDIFAECVRLDLATGGAMLHPRRKALTRWWLAHTLYRLGRFEQAEPLAQEAVAIVDAALSPNDMLIPVAHSLHAACITRLGRADEAEPVLRESYERLCELVGVTNGNTANAVQWLRRLHAARDRPADAEPVLRDYATQLVAAGADARTLNRAAWYLAALPGLSTEAYDAALAAAQRAAALAPETSYIINTLGVAECRAGRWDDALQTLTRSASLHSGGEMVADAAFLAIAHHHAGHAAEARTALQRARRLLEEQPGAESRRFVNEAAALLGH